MNIKEQGKGIQMTGKLHLLTVVSRITLLSGGDNACSQTSRRPQLVKQSAFLGRNLGVL